MSDGDRGAGNDANKGGRGATPRRDHDVAREAVVRGNAVPLAKVLPAVRARVDGDVLDVRLKQLSSGVLVYEVTVLSSAGEYRSIVIDAKRNKIIGIGQR